MKRTKYIKTSDKIDLWTELYGDTGNEACLLISGAGANSSFWSERLCKTLVQNGFFVIKYDHRDFGYSSKIDYEKNPYDFMQLVFDPLSILDSLKINKAHILGHSMGGFIAQLMAINFPDRVLSIGSFSSSTNSPDIPAPPEKTWEIFIENSPVNDFEKDLPRFIKVWKYLNGIARFDEPMAIEYTRNLYERQDITGALGESHVKAQATLTDRTKQLKKIKIPALVIHGGEDYLVDKSGGIRTAGCIEHSKLVLIPEMGHIPFNNEILDMFENEILKFLENNKTVD